MRPKKILFLIAISMTLIYSCRKEIYNLQNQHPNDNISEVDSIRKTFDDKKYNENLVLKINDTLSIKWDVNWNNYSKSNLGDTLTYFYFPLTSLRYNEYKKTTGKPILEINIKKFLLVGKLKGEIFFRLATYIFNANGKKVKSIGENYNLQNFSGNIEYRNLDIKTTNFSSYSNGLKIANSNIKKENSIQKNDGFQQECYNQLTCYYYGSCNGSEPYITAVSGRDFCPSPPAQPGSCLGIFYGWTYGRTDVDYVCENVYYPDPPIVIPIFPPTDGSGTVSGIDHVDDPTKKPCPGDPVKLSIIAPSTVTNIKGGRYGLTRTKRLNGVLVGKYHWGLDIAARPNTPLYPVMSGTILDMRTSFAPGQYKENSLGNYIIIKTILPSGAELDLLYAHLNTIKPGLAVGSSVTLGTSMALTGRTGNPAGTDVHFPHVHIQAKLNGQKADPEPYLRTKFNSTGAATVTPC